MNGKQENNGKSATGGQADPIISLDLGLLIELLNDHTDGWYKMINNKSYNLITNTQLLKIIENYIKRKN